MRLSRIKIPPEEESAVYHCVTRTVNREHLFDDVAREVLRQQLWQIADYCGLSILTYAILSNHFHVVVHVPKRDTLPDAELLRRYTVLYPQSTTYQSARFQVIRAELHHNTPEAVAWRKRQLALMGDVSQFMKLLKQRFSIWFNRTHQRIGTLWAERFKSVLVEARDHVLQTIAAYVDLNAVRAGLTRDPKDYRFCGYAEAVVGNVRAQSGIATVMGTNAWADTQAGYREVLFGTGANAREGAASISAEELQRVLREGGTLSRATVLRCRLRFFTDGAILGTRAFVATRLAAHRRMTNVPPQRTTARFLPLHTHWGDLAALRGFRLSSTCHPA